MFSTEYSFNKLQKISMSIMSILMVITFIGANLHALLWQSSNWLVSTVLPAVVIDLTNEERLENNANKLYRNSTLDKAATLKAEHMAKQQYFAHYSPEGISPWYWFNKAGYEFAYAGENLAIHFTDSTEVVEAWMDSPDHRENIINNLYTEIGVGTAKGTYEGYETVYVVQLFGTPAKISEPIQVDIEPVISTGTPEMAINHESIMLTIEEKSDQAEIDAIDMVAEEVAGVEFSTSTYNPVAEANEIHETNPETISDSYRIMDDIVVLQSPTLATSSGLTIAQITALNEGHAGKTLGTIATQPNTLLQYLYFILGTVVCLLLSTSIVLEVRRLHLVQVAYGLLLLAGMGCLWYMHLLLTEGAVIV